MNEVRNVSIPPLQNRHLEVRRNAEQWGALMRIWDAIFRTSCTFMQQQGSLLFDLPITTRMISSPGALTGTIPSDVDPFFINFFEIETFLTQSSQLYLEFAITNPEVQSVYCWEKSFRREPADFRHLPEFTYIEWEGNVNFEKNISFQEAYFKSLLEVLLRDNKKDIQTFLDDASIRDLSELVSVASFPRVTFHEAFSLLRKHTNDAKYDQPTIAKFSAYEEALLTNIIGMPVFVTHYNGNEVAFYHAPDPNHPELVLNADFLFPGYGELIGSGERVHTREETAAKAKHFQLNFDDYQAYIDSRDEKNPVTHSGWGMGVERFLQAVLKLPFIWDAKPFPRVHNQNRP